MENEWIEKMKKDWLIKIISKGCGGELGMECQVKIALAIREKIEKREKEYINNINGMIDNKFENSENMTMKKYAVCVLKEFIEILKVNEWGNNVL